MKQVNKMSRFVRKYGTKNLEKRNILSTNFLEIQFWISLLLNRSHSMESLLPGYCNPTGSQRSTRCSFTIQQGLNAHCATFTQTSTARHIQVYIPLEIASAKRVEPFKSKVLQCFMGGWTQRLQNLNPSKNLNWKNCEG